MNVPPLRGLPQTLRAHPALKRWAKLFRPCGTCDDALQAAFSFVKIVDLNGRLTLLDRVAPFVSITGPITA